MNLFMLAIVLGLVSPPLAAAGFAYRWRRSLRQAGWFIGLAGIAFYVLMAFCTASALSDIGISGARPHAPAPFIDPLLLRYLSFMLGWLGGSVLIAYLLRYILSKR